MHQCLQISEIISQVFSEIDGHVYDTRMQFPARIRHREGEALRTLAGLARTCQVFTQPALDVLWRAIPDLFVLVKHLMPDELLKYNEDSSELFLLQEPSADVWKSLDPYVARIRVVGILSPSGVIARSLDAETVLRPLERHLSQIAANHDVLFPKLEHVVYHAVWAHGLYARLLLHPYLRELQLPVTAYTSQWGLTPLADDREMSIRTLSAHIPHALRRMQNLRALWVKSSLLDQPTFAHLGSLPTLTEFALEGDWTITVGHPPRATTGPRAFAALRELSVTMMHVDIPSFLAHIDPECLEAVNIHWGCLHGGPPVHAANEFHSLLTLLLTLLPCLPHIKHLSVALDEVMERRLDLEIEIDREDHVLSRRRMNVLPDSGWCLSPILSCTALRTLEIGVDIIFQVTEAFLMDLAQRMPFLESLRLTPFLRGPFPLAYSQGEAGRVLKVPTLDGLLPFVERCTRLTKLRLVVRGTLGKSTPGSRDTPRRSLNRIRTLELWATALDPGIADEMFVAFFLRAFPSLEELLVVIAKHPSEHTDREPVTRSEAYARWKRVVGNVSCSLAQRPDGGSMRWEVI